MPTEYGAPLPTLEQMPEALRTQVEAFRARPTGQYMLRLYKERRTGPGN
ncbi:MAG: hypothetical protein U9R74_05135 [Pseudomonadota bacterium]|nr:hypothetical protein [Pseudomonadota bacterium]